MNAPKNNLTKRLSTLGHKMEGKGWLFHQLLGGLAAWAKFLFMFALGGSVTYVINSRPIRSPVARMG